MKIEITTSDLSAPARARLTAALASPGAISRAAAESALPVYQRQLVKNGQSNRNRFGARGSFWRRMVDGTRAGEGFVAMPREMRLRVYGGTVKPLRSKYLTIPLRTEAYGKSLRQFERVFFVRRGGRLFACTKALSVPISRKGARNKNGARKLKETGEGGRITVLYMLVTSATIRGDSALLPAASEVGAAVERGVTGFLRRR